MSTTINISDHEDEELKFQEFPLDHPDPPHRISKGHLGDFPDFETGEEQEELLKEEQGDKPKPSFVEFAYYQSFWNVDTSQVMQRIMWSMVPVSGRNSFLNLHVKNNPDLYGPFWISITLILSIAISSNIADYLSSAGRTNHIWHYDFHKVTIAAITIFSYISLLPLTLFSLLKYNTMRGVRYTLLEILCAYGYSIFIYIPISILWVIQVPTLQWTLVIVGALLSGSVLVKNFWPVLRHTNIKVGALVLALILTFHTLLAASFVLYFFKPAPHFGEVTIPENVFPPASIPQVPGSDGGLIPIEGGGNTDQLPPSSKVSEPAPHAEEHKKTSQAEHKTLGPTQTTQLTTEHKETKNEVKQDTEKASKEPPVSTPKPPTTKETPKLQQNSSHPLEAKSHAAKDDKPTYLVQK